MYTFLNELLCAAIPKLMIVPPVIDNKQCAYHNVPLSQAKRNTLPFNHVYCTLISWDVDEFSRLSHAVQSLL